MSHKANFPLQGTLHFTFCNFPLIWSLVASTLPCWVPCPESLAGGVPPEDAAGLCVGLGAGRVQGQPDGRGGVAWLRAVS